MLEITIKRHLKTMHTVQCAQSLSCVWLFVTTWAVAHQASMSMGISRQEHWSGLQCPLPDIVQWKNLICGCPWMWMIGWVLVSLTYPCSPFIHALLRKHPGHPGPLTKHCFFGYQWNMVGSMSWTAMPSSLLLFIIQSTQVQRTLFSHILFNFLLPLNLSNLSKLDEKKCNIRFSTKSLRLWS